MTPLKKQKPVHVYLFLQSTESSELYTCTITELLLKLPVSLDYLKG